MKAIICRCEDVTRKDLAAAVEQGHRDLESAKRYTGLATGWCQGKQCLPLVCPLLEQLTGRPVERPTTPRPPLHPVALGELGALEEP